MSHENWQFPFEILFSTSIKNTRENDLTFIATVLGSGKN